jgi:uncharacterized protein
MDHARTFRLTLALTTLTSIPVDTHDSQMGDDALLGAPEPADVADPAILIRINQLYEPGMSAEELYDTTRGVWKVAERRDRARLALAVYHGEVLEAYEIEAWHPAGSTAYTSRVIDVARYGNRWEFTGRLAPEVVRNRYVGKSVAHYFEQGAANPVRYVNC